MTPEINALIEAALDQRNPSPKLKATLNAVLTKEQHPAAVR